MSVVLPVRDEEQYLEEAVRSILDQTFSDFELLVVDDGSTDGTPAVLARLAEEDARLHVLRNETSGLINALNAGIAAARGAYVARMDADDVSLPERLARQVAALDERPELGVIGSRVRYVDAERRPIGEWNVPVGSALVHWTLLFGTPLAHPAVTMRRRVLPERPYSTDAPHAEDYDLWVRLAGKTELDNLPEVLLERRVHGESVSDRNLEAQEDSGRRIRRRAVARLLGAEPTDDDLRALQTPSSVAELVRAARLVRRLYSASETDATVRRDAIRRVVVAARVLVRR